MTHRIRPLRIGIRLEPWSLVTIGLAAALTTMQCSTEPAALTATYTLAMVDDRPAPTDLEDGFYLDAPALTRAVNRRLDFSRPDSAKYSGRIEKLVRHQDGSVQVEFGFDFCILHAGYVRQGSMVVLKYPVVPGQPATRDPWFFTSSDTLYLEGDGIRQVERQIVGGTSFATHVYRYTADPPSAGPISCPTPQ